MKVNTITLALLASSFAFAAVSGDGDISANPRLRALLLQDETTTTLEAHDHGHDLAAADDPNSPNARSLESPHNDHKATLCHFDKANGKHILLNLPKNSINAHLKDHPDDLLNPPGQTSLTRIKLDVNCEVVPTVSLISFYL